jgi:hypothetical protein
MGDESQSQEWQFGEVVAIDCHDCGDEFWQAVELDGWAPGPNGVIVVPQGWMNRTCPHGRQGVRIESRDEDDYVAQDASDEDGGSDSRWEPFDRLDATRRMSQWARENGRYGSHASHDRFDGDSEA